MIGEKEIRKAKRVNSIAFGIAIVVILGIIMASAIASNAITVYDRNHTFSTSKWLDDPENRAAIVDDLLKKHELVGMTEEEVIALLGENNNDRGYFNADNRYVYYLGLDQGFSIDCQWLILDFTDGVVSKTFIETD